MKLVAATDPILRAELERFDFSNPPVNPMELAQELIEFMYENNGLGLAANQVGLPYRVFVMRGNSDTGDIVCFNPRVVDVGEKEALMEEGCLSYPGLLVKIKRPQSIKVRFQLPDGDTTTQTFAGLSSRVFQHELDHLNGVVHVDRASRFHKDQALRKQKKLLRTVDIRAAV